jgi:uncharacterized membrane protein
VSLLVAAHRAGLTGRRLAEIGFLLMLIAGIWLVAAETLRVGRARGIVAGSALAVGALVLIVAVHWEHFH